MGTRDARASATRPMHRVHASSACISSRYYARYDPLMDRSNRSAAGIKPRRELPIFSFSFSFSSFFFFYVIFLVSRNRTACFFSSRGGGDGRVKGTRRQEMGAETFIIVGCASLRSFVFLLLAEIRTREF